MYCHSRGTGISKFNHSCHSRESGNPYMWNYNFYVYIIANKSNTVLYIGVTNDLKRRIYEHKNKLVEGFTKKYNVSKLIYFEHYISIEEAIKREKQLKKWNRRWKDELIEKENPEWIELQDQIEGFPLSRE